MSCTTADILSLIRSLLRFHVLKQGWRSEKEFQQGSVLVSSVYSWSLADAIYYCSVSCAGQALDFVHHVVRARLRRCQGQHNQYRTQIGLASATDKRSACRPLSIVKARQANRSKLHCRVLRASRQSCARMKSAGVQAQSTASCSSRAEREATRRCSRDLDVRNSRAHAELRILARKRTRLDQMQETLIMKLCCELCKHDAGDCGSCPRGWW